MVDELRLFKARVTESGILAIEPYHVKVYADRTFTMRGRVEVSDAVWQPNRTIQYLAAAGIVGPVLYTVAWLVLGFLDATYSHVRDPISNLSAIGAPFALVMTSIIFVFALLIMAFAFGLHRGLPSGPWAWAGPGALVIAGIGYVGIGLAPLNLAEPADPNLPHNLSAAVTVFGLMLAPILLYPRLRRAPKWKNIRGYSIATTVVALVVALVIPASLPAFMAWGAGLQQRLVLAVVLVWMIVIAIRLLRGPPAQVSPAS